MTMKRLRGWRVATRLALCCYVILVGVAHAAEVHSNADADPFVVDRTVELTASTASSRTHPSSSHSIESIHASFLDIVQHFAGRSSGRLTHVGDEVRTNDSSLREYKAPLNRRALEERTSIIHPEDVAAASAVSGVSRLTWKIWNRSSGTNVKTEDLSNAKPNERDQNVKIATSVPNNNDRSNNNPNNAVSMNQNSPAMNGNDGVRRNIFNHWNGGQGASKGVAKKSNKTSKGKGGATGTKANKGSKLYKSTKGSKNSKGSKGRGNANQLDNNWGFDFGNDGFLITEPGKPMRMMMVMTMTMPVTNPVRQPITRPTTPVRRPTRKPTTTPGRSARPSTTRSRSPSSSDTKAPTRSPASIDTAVPSNAPSRTPR